MYTILNKQNDYRTNKTKLTLMENKYTSLMKLVSNQDGNLTEAMLLNIKEKQDLSYNSMSTTIPILKPILEDLSINSTIDSTIEYTTLDTEKIKPFEEGYFNYVNIVLLTSIMKNEVNLSNMSKSMFDQIYIAESSFNSSRTAVRNKAISKGVYVPVEYTRVNPSTITASILNAMNLIERKEFEKTFFELKYKFPKSVVSVEYGYIGQEYYPDGYYYDSTCIINPNSKLNIYVKSTVKAYETTIENGDVYLDSLYGFYKEGGSEFHIGDFYRGGVRGITSTSDTFQGRNYVYEITDSIIKITVGWASSMLYPANVTTKTLVSTPSKISANYITSNF